MDEEGHVVKRERFSNDTGSLSSFMKDIGEAKVVMESGYCWQPIYDRLEEAGYDVRLAHPLKVKAIAEAKIKTDEIDSETLAHLLRADLLPESYVPPREIRDLRELVKRRAFLVGMRTRLKNRIHAELAKRDIDLGTPLFTKQGRALLASLGVDSVSQLLPVMETLDRQIGEISGTLKRAAAEDGRARILTTIPGVGYYTALLLVAEIGDVNRFPDAERLCSYAGLVPSVRRSGGSTVYGHITKEGSRWMRWGLTEAVHSHLRYDTELTRFHRRLSSKKPGQVATTATARKMLKAIYWMLKAGEPFQP
jgi:transposase